MTKKTKILAISGILGLATATAAFAGNTMTEKEFKVVQDKFPKLLKNPSIEFSKGVNENGFKHIELIAKDPRGQRPSQKFEIFITDSKEPVAFIGKAFNTNGEPYLLPVDSEIVKKGVAFTISDPTYKGKKEDLYLVTDPQCPYCQRFEENMDKEIAKKYNIHVIPMPLSFHDQAKPMLYWVLSAKTKAEQADRMEKVMKGDMSYKKFSPTPEQKATADKVFEDANNAASELGAQGTPMVFDKDMKPIENYFFLMKQVIPAQTR